MLRIFEFLRSGKTVLALAVAVAAAGVMELHRHRERFEEWSSPLWVRTISDVPYGPRSENRLDILRRRWRDAGGGHPAVVVFHGGGWRNGNRRDMLVRVCHRYLEQGFVVANVEYRLGAVSAAVEDADLALRWFLHHASAYGVDRSKVVVTGESAGAHLALIAAFRSEQRVAAVVNFYGVSDLASMLNGATVRSVLPRENAERLARDLSPSTYVRRELPPIFSIHGTADDVVPSTQTDHLTRAIRDAGGDADELYVPGAKHGFSASEQEEAYRAVFTFLRKCGIR